MAAFDLGLLKEFDVIFPMLLTFVIVYGFLVETKLFENNSWNATIAIALSIMTAFSSIAIKTINKMAPWLVLLVVFILFLMFVFMVFGVEQKAITEVVKSNSFGYVKMIIIAIVVVIFLGSLMSSISEEQGFLKLTKEGGVAPVPAPGEGTPTEQTEFYKTVFHPKILGMAAVLLIMVFAITQLAAAPEKPYP